MLQSGLPGFSLDDFGGMLRALRTAGYGFAPVRDMPLDDQDTRTCYLRHDVDMHLRGLDAVGGMEAAHGVRATYFIALTLPYNPLYLPNRRVLQTLVAQGHEIGLHYNLATYPEDADGARDHLQWEVDVLSALVGEPVKSIVMHEPHRFGSDPFIATDDFLHPHDPRLQRDLSYISDSCRAWRDDRLVDAMSGRGTRRLLLNTHPELWLGSAGTERSAFLAGVLRDNGLADHVEYFTRTIASTWDRHPAPALHDAREGGPPAGGRVS